MRNIKTDLKRMKNFVRPTQYKTFLYRRFLVAKTVMGSDLQFIFSLKVKKILEQY